ncbi:MAG: hypothetical protein ABL886_05495 [Rhodoglobus sp.]
MSQPPASTGRVLGAIVFLAIGGTIGLMATFGFFPRVLGAFGQNWSGSATIFTPRMPFLDSWAEIDKDYADAYNGLIFSSSAPLVESRWLTAAEGALDSLVIIAGCVLLVIIAIRVMMARSISRVARSGLVILGVLVILDATLGPQFAPLASDIALQQLGYPIVGPDDPGFGFMTENTPEAVMLALWDPIWVMNRFDFTLLFLGLLALLFGTLTLGRAKTPLGE